jgi:excisionase family DNA binding protein
MTPTKSPFDSMLDAFREIVREELVKLQPPKPEKLLLNTTEAAELLNLPPTWVAEAGRSGKIPTVRLGAYVRFKKSDLEKYIEDERNSKQ